MQEFYWTLQVDSVGGKTSLTASQKQTLACDPDEPLGGSTSATFDPAIVNVIDFGFGPGYYRSTVDTFLRWAVAHA